MLSKGGALLFFFFFFSTRKPNPTHQDAYAYSGQKCSAQSILFAHENWAAVGIEEKLAKLAARRSLADLTVGPVLSVRAPPPAAPFERRVRAHAVPMPYPFSSTRVAARRQWRPPRLAIVFLALSCG